jgi:hypothetical protein
MHATIHCVALRFSAPAGDRIHLLPFPKMGAHRSQLPRLSYDELDPGVCP